MSRVCSNTSTFVPHDLAQCPLCASHVTRCAFDVHLAVGTTRRPTKHGFSGIPVRFLSRLWGRRACLEKTLSLVMSPVRSLCAGYGPVLRILTAHFRTGSFTMAQDALHAKDALAVAFQYSEDGTIHVDKTQRAFFNNITGSKVCS